VFEKNFDKLTSLALLQITMMTEFAKTFMTIEFVKVLLGIFGMVAAVYVWIWFNHALAAQTAGWKNLVEKFPATEIERPGDTFKKQTGWIGNTEFSRNFTVQLIQEGMRICPFFASRSPLLIPWSKITEVTVPQGTVFGVQQYITLTVEWEKQFKFSLPPKVLPTIEANVSMSRFRKIEIAPLSELVKERWKNWKSS
jgi:hypothetical protein